MNRAIAPYSVLLAALISLSSPTSTAAERPPNIILILADDLGWADLGCYGNRFNETPNLDRLAQSGMKFTSFYAAGAVCSPTRAAIQSGRYQARYGLTAHIPGHWKPFERLAEPPVALELPLSVETIAERLKAAGYRTGYFGKWHLGARGFGPADQGYDDVFEFNGHAVPGPRQAPPTDAPRRETEYLAAKAVAFVEANRSRPFFIQVSSYAVHIPLDTTPALAEKYSKKPKVEGYSCHPLYAGLLEELDNCVGTIVAAVDRLNLARETLIVFTSDNGGLEREVGGWPGTLNRPLRNEKGSLYEGGIRVPMIARWPGAVPENTTSDAPAISVDFYPTILAAAGIAVQADQPLDGVSLVPLLRDPGAPFNRGAPLYWHYPHYHHSRPSGAIRVGDWKLIEFFDTGELELFNLKDDVSEKSNRAGDSRQRAALMHQLLKQWRHNVGAQMPQRNPAYDPKRAGEWWNRATIAPTQAPGTYRPVP